MEDITEYTVSIEMTKVLDQERADYLVKEIQHRLDDLNEDVYVCISHCRKMRSRTTGQVSPAVSLVAR